MKQVPLRFDEREVMPRVKALLAEISRDEDFNAMRMSASTVLRMALLAGIGVLEQRYGLAKKS